MTHKESIAVIDFGSQYSRLIARRTRENHVFSVLLPPETSLERLRELNVRGVILSGGPDSVYSPGAPTCAAAILRSGLPVLGICYGMHVGCRLLGGAVERAGQREFGRARLKIRRPECFS